MPQLGNITINNGESTPVAKTFNPAQIDAKGVAEYADRSDGISIGFPTITVSSKKQNNGGRKVRVNIALPVLEAPAAATAEGYTAAPKVAYVNRSNHEFFLASRSVTADREDLLAFSKNILADAVAEALVENLENVY